MDKLLNVRKEIDAYLKIMKNIETKVNEVLNSDKSVEEMLMPANENREWIRLKVDIIKKKQNYVKEKQLFEAAVNEFRSIFKGKDKKKLTKQIAHKYEISHSVFEKEILKYNNLENYQFDRKTKDPNHYFTYKQEKSLLESLEQLAKNKQDCSCRVCVLIQLSTLAYKYAVEQEIKCPELWQITEMTDIPWLRKFEIRHSDEMSSFCSESCSLPHCQK